MKMKKFSALLAGLSMFGVLLTTSCNNSGGGITELERVNPFTFTSSLYGLSINGEGLKSLPFSKLIEDETGRERRAITNVRVLVVPVDFTDYPAESLPMGAQGTIDAIETIVFGEAEETGWNSLASYYESTSFGQCHVTGTVADWYHTNQTVKEFAKYNGGSTYATQGLVRDLQAIFPEDATEEGGIGLDDFDSNNDYYVDALVMLYTCPPLVRDSLGKAIDDDLYWAFCWNWTGAAGNNIHTSFYKFFWASIDTFFEGGVYDDQGNWRNWTDEEIANGTAELDAHTLIHEFGHILGLPDYYTYDNNDYHPLGMLDMMAHNVGDHNAFSKTLYGWTSPYVVTESCTVELQSTTTTGDFILIPVGGDWKGNMTSQYLMLELLTPDGVAVLDGEYAYRGGAYPQYFNEIGIRAIHVDARMGLFTYNSSSGQTSFSGYTSNYNGGTSGYVTFAHSNTASQSAYSSCRLIEIVPATGNPISVDKTATNDSLYQEGDKFGVKGGVWQNYMMNGSSGEQDTPLGFGFEVLKIDAETKTATIKISKL